MQAAAFGLQMLRRPRVGLALAIGAAWLLVLARSYVYAAFPHAAFDSDQAIVGLMAKHLSEGRAFPLYLYGYAYMLGVESWVAVPYFWIAGPTVAALRASIIGTNLLVVTLLVIGLCRWGGLRPAAAVMACAFFAFVPPNTAANLIDASGGAIEQFLWVIVLWFVRRRPFAFGSILAVGFLNREFVIYAVPVLIAGQCWSRDILTRDTWRAWLLAMVAFVAVWQGVEALKPLADLMGPGTRGGTPHLESSSQAGNLAQRMRVDLGSTPGDSVVLLRGEVASLLGGHRQSGIAEQGRDWLGWVLAVAALAALARILWLAARGDRPVATAVFGWYVLGIGVATVLGYAVTRPTDIVTPRYLLLSLFIPVGMTAVWLALEPRRSVRIGIAAIVVTWASVSAVDTWRQYERYASGREVDQMQELIEALDDRGVTIAEAEHWRAYKLTFLTRERIRVASTDVVRIREYRDLADAAGPELIRLQHAPCPGGAVAGGMYICGGADGGR